MQTLQIVIKNKIKIFKNQVFFKVLLEKLNNSAVKHAYSAKGSLM